MSHDAHLLNKDTAAPPPRGQRIVELIVIGWQGRNVPTTTDCDNSKSSGLWTSMSTRGCAVISIMYDQVNRCRGIMDGGENASQLNALCIKSPIQTQYITLHCMSQHTCPEAKGLHLCLSKCCPFKMCASCKRQLRDAFQVMTLCYWKKRFEVGIACTGREMKEK